MSDKHYIVSRSDSMSQIGLTAPPITQTSHDERVQIQSQSTRPQISSGSMSTLSSTPGAYRKRKLSLIEVGQLRRKVSENEGLRILSTASRYAEKGAVRCYLGGGGSPAEYPNWRNRLPPVPLISYLVANRLDSDNMSEDLYSLLRSNTSTLRSAAVSQDGGSGTSPSHSTGGTNQLQMTSYSQSSSSQDKHISRPVMRLPVSPYKSSLSPLKHESGGDVSPSNQEHIVERAKQEVHVMQRVAELVRDGLWSENRVPKLQELPRPKSHWDYLLEEMVWLAADFAQERKWKKAAAKKCALMVQKYFRDKETSARREAEEREAELRRIARIMSHEIKLFWSYINKLFIYKRRNVVEESRKHMLNSLKIKSSCTIENNSIKNIEAKDEDEEVKILKKESCLPLEELLGDYLEVRNTLPSSPSEITEKCIEDNKSSKNLSDVEETVHLSEVDDLDDTVLDDENVSSSDSSYDESSCDEDTKIKSEPLSSFETIEYIITVAETIQPLGQTQKIDIQKIDVPFLLRNKLRDYQIIGYNWLVSLYKKELNCILADEAALGKSVQVIALFAHLAHVNGLWGPHLIVVPTLEVVCWENEFKRWCPSLKILGYYGSPDERKVKRFGWSRPNSFHVCITSYQLVLEDLISFRKKKWKYLVLDEAHHIQNFNSIRWQSFKNIRSLRKIILSDYPLNLNQLNSFAPFILPDWCLKENSECNQILKHLTLSRTKTQVEDQMIRRTERVINCPLSIKQKKFYDDYMNNSLEKLNTCELIPILSVLMDLKKICNHPDLFREISVRSPVFLQPIEMMIPSIVATALDYDPFRNIDILSWDFNLIGLESCISAFVAHRSRRFKTPKRLIEEIDNTPESPQCPRKLGGIKINVQKKSISSNVALKPMVRPALVQIGSGANSRVSPTKIGTSPIVKAAVIQPTVSQGVTLRLANPIGQIQNYLQIVGQQGKVTQTARLAHIVNTPTGKQILISPHQLLSSQPSTVVTASGQRLTVVSKQGMSPASLRPLLRLPPLAVSSSPNLLIGSTNSDNTDPIVMTKSNLYDNPSKILLEKTTKTMTDKSINMDNAIETKPYLKKNHTDKDISENTDKRREKLNLIYRMNDKRCSRLPVYGMDVVGRVTVNRNFKHTNWSWSGSVQCWKSKNSFDSEYNNLSHCILSLEQRFNQIKNLSKFIVNVPPAYSPGIKLKLTKGSPFKNDEKDKVESVFAEMIAPFKDLLNPIISESLCQLPNLKMMKYDSGKLMVLKNILNSLKLDRKRAVIFCHMSRMLDILELFLCSNNLSYLRLDSTTDIDRRDIIVEKYNNDPSVLCLILSSRTGCSVNFVGADSIIFYDLDWNPTMYSHVKKICDSILWTKDISVYKLLADNTVEKSCTDKLFNMKYIKDSNTIKSGDNVVTTYCESSAIYDIFGKEELKRDVEKILEEKGCLSECCLADGGYLESLLDSVEDSVDSMSSKMVEAELAVKLKEFNEDETVSGNDEDTLKKETDDEQELTGIEKYAMRFVEEMEVSNRDIIAEENWEMVKQGWETNRFEKEQINLKRKRESFSDDEDLTYSSIDAHCPDWVTKFGLSMPMWTPPTPPQDDNDMYIDESLCLLYEPTLIPEAQLPPAYTKKDKKRRIEMNLMNSRLQSSKIRQKEETLVHAPRSLFDRPSPALVKMRHELRLQRYRGLMRPSVQNLLKAPVQVKPLPEPDHVPDWLIHEDWTILQAIQQVQEMSLNLVVLLPGHTPNWDLVADMVNLSSRTYRSPKQCRNRYESIIIPREEGKPVPDSPKKQKKNKLLYKPPQLKSGRPLKTSQLFQQDNNSSMTQVMNCRFDAIRSVSARRTPAVKPLLVDPTMKNNPRHADTLARSQIDYDRPLTPIEVAAKRADRIAREKHLSSTPIQVTGLGDQTQLAVARQQQLQKLATLTVQEMVATVGGNRTVLSTGGLPVNRSVTAEVKAGTGSPSPSGSGGGSSAPTSPSTSASSVAAKTTTKTISATQLAIYRQQQHQQALLRQQQQLKLLKSQQGAGGTAGGGSPTPPKVSIAVTPPQSPATGTTAVTTVPRMQQVVVKSSRAVTESEMMALLKRQQAAKVSGGGQSPATLTTAQILTSIQVKALNSATAQGDATTVLPQQVKPITLPHQFLAAAAAAHQQRTGKIAGGQQKVAQFAQVPAKGGAGGTQLIVQSGHKTLPTTVTVQQIQQVMKQVRPGHVVVAGPGRSTTIPGTVSLEGRQVLAGALKTSQQAILTQVSGITGASRSGTTPLVSAPLITIPPSSSQTQTSTDNSSNQHH